MGPLDAVRDADGRADDPVNDGQIVRRGPTPQTSAGYAARRDREDRPSRPVFMIVVNVKAGAVVLAIAATA